MLIIIFAEVLDLSSHLRWSTKLTCNIQSGFMKAVHTVLLLIVMLHQES